MRRVPRVVEICRLFVAIAVIITAACSGSPNQQTIPDEIVGLNNRGVGLMGQFNYDGAREIFARLATAHPDRLDLQVNLALATLNRQRDGDAEEARRILERVSA